MANAPEPYDPRKPYNRRTYYVRSPSIPRYQAGQPAPGAFAGGSQFGGDLVKGIVNLMQQNRMNAVANQILNTRNPPRAALVGQGRVPTQVWDNPATWQLLRQKGLGIQGTEKATGGTMELALRNEQAKAELANQQAQVENALKMAQIQDYLAKVAGTGYYAKQQTPTKAGDWHQQLEEQKQRNAQTKAFQSWQEKNALDSTKLAQHFDKIYGGKGSAENFYNAVTSGTGLRGNLVNGQFIPDENGEYYTHDADTARGSPGLFGVGARPATSKQLKGSLIKYNDLQAYIDKAKQIEDAGGKLYPTEYPKELYGPAPRATLINAAPGAAQTTQALPSGVSPAPRATLVNALSLPSGVSPEVPVPSDLDSGANAQLPTPQTQDDYDAIPSGSDFIDVDGIQKTKT
jgi:hypothetical protein